MDGMSDHAIVAVIGAGLSGLSCAHSLRVDHGVEDVVVLEARDRIGGRMHTVMEGGTPLEMGAQWLHGGDGQHCVYQFAIRYLLCHASKNVKQQHVIYSNVMYVQTVM